VGSLGPGYRPFRTSPNLSLLCSHIASDRRQRIPVDDASQVWHIAALAFRTATWLRDEEAAVPATCPVGRLGTAIHGH
jgi:hypothetical protein